MCFYFHTIQGPVQVTKSRNHDLQECWELLIIPNPETGWGVSQFYPLETEITQEVAKQFAHETIQFL